MHNPWFCLLLNSFSQSQKFINLFCACYLHVTYLAGHFANHKAVTFYSAVDISGTLCIVSVETG